MPSHNVQGPNPQDVMPLIVMQAFNEQLRIEALVNDGYTDGSSDRVALSNGARAFFRVTGRLTPATWQSLRNFYLTHKGKAFYFYFGRECSPPYHYDPTGGATQGRYTVVFDGSYAETYTINAAQVAFGLREVA